VSCNGGVHGEPLESVEHYAFQMAQGRRVVRYCAEQGIDFAGLLTGRVDQSVLAPICDPDGQVVPEPVDWLE
jgi:hypothetical protein